MSFNGKRLMAAAEALAQDLPVITPLKSPLFSGKLGRDRLDGSGPMAELPKRRAESAHERMAEARLALSAQEICEEIERSRLFLEGDLDRWQIKILIREEEKEPIRFETNFFHARCHEPNTASPWKTVVNSFLRTEKLLCTLPRSEDLKTWSVSGADSIRYKAHSNVRQLSRSRYRHSWKNTYRLQVHAPDARSAAWKWLAISHPTHAEAFLKNGDPSVLNALGITAIEITTDVSIAGEDIAALHGLQV